MKKMILGAMCCVLCAAAGEAAVRAATPAMPDSEWAKAWWPKRFAEKQELVKTGGAPYVFVGDSITQLFETGAGREVWRKYFGGKDAPYPALNLGYSGDRTEHVLYRLEHGELDGYEAKCVVLLIGTNNTGHRSAAEETPGDTVIGIKACLDAIRAKQPKAKVVLCSLFPRGANAQVEARRRNDVVNRAIRQFADGRHVFWCDLSRMFTRRDGTLPAELFPDFLHPAELGYEMWASRIIPYFDGLGASTFPAEIPDGELADRGPSSTWPQPKVWADWWIGKFARNRERIASCGGELDIVMLGDSITHYWEVGEGLDDSHDIEILEKKYRIMNCGYGGDRIENLLWRVQNGELDGYTAKLITLMIGTNNSLDNPEDVIVGVRNLIGEIYRKQPQAKILIMGYLPCGEKRDDRRRVTLDAVRPALKTFVNAQTVRWFDCSDKFLNPDGTTKKELFDYEYLHPSTEGYRVWREALEPELEKLLGK